MNDKEKYLRLMQHYFDAGTTPAEERELAAYAAATDDPDFAVLRGVLGFLSVGREKKKVRRDWKPTAIAVAASLAAIAAIGLRAGRETKDETLIRQTVEASLADFFSGSPQTEVQLTEMFSR